MVLTEAGAQLEMIAPPEPAGAPETPPHSWYDTSLLHINKQFKCTGAINILLRQYDGNKLFLSNSEVC